MNEIRFENVSVYYQNDKSVITALNDLSLSFEMGKFNVVIGKSGSGKTSLLRCLSGQAIYKGEILFNKENLSSLPVNKRKLSLVDQNIILYPNLTVYENLMFPLKVMKVEHETADQKIKDIASKLGFDCALSRKPKNISLGQASRVSLARAFLKESDVYLFDEPFANLDNQNKNEICDLIKKTLKKENKTAIFVTHNIPVALSLADKIFVLDEGALLGEFTPKELLASKNKLVNDLLAEIKNEEN